MTEKLTIDTPETSHSLGEWLEQAKAHKSQGLNIRVSVTQLADWLGLTRQAVSSNMERWKLPKDPQGRVRLFDAVHRYCESCRSFVRVKPPKTDVETETLLWKLENIKLQNKDWRLRRDRDMVNAVLDALQSAMTRLKQELDGDQKARTAIDRFLSELALVDNDSISMVIEGEDFTEGSLDE